MLVTYIHCFYYIESLSHSATDPRSDPLAIAALAIEQADDAACSLAVAG